MFMNILYIKTRDLILLLYIRYILFNIIYTHISIVCTSTGVRQNASVFTGVAMAAMGFSDIIEVHRPGEDSDAGVSIIVNGINFEMDSSSVTFNGQYLLVSLR